MTEDEARAWIADRFGAPALARLAVFADLVVAEAPSQNLIAASTLATIWCRHIVDSAQLVGMTQGRSGLWMDIGTGAGFPGLVAAVLTDNPMVLVEPRRKRVEFLRAAIEALELGARVVVEQSKSDAVTARAAIISARAVSRIGALICGAVHCSTNDTIWLLPKGRNAREEVAEAARSWHGTFHVEQSITDPGSLIVTATKVSRR